MLGERTFAREGGSEIAGAARIRDAALTLFAARGTESPSMRQIAAAAGVSVGLVQHYFVTKANLIQAVDDHVMNVLAETLAAPLAGAPRDPVTEVADRATQLLAEHMEVIDYVSRALADNSPIGMRVFDGFVEISTGYWAQISEQGLTRPGLDPDWMVFGPLSLVLGTFMLRAHLARHLSGVLNEPTQLQRWRDSTETIITRGQLRHDSRDHDG